MLSRRFLPGKTCGKGGNPAQKENLHVRGLGLKLPGLHGIKCDLAVQQASCTACRGATQCRLAASPGVRPQLRRVGWIARMLSLTLMKRPKWPLRPPGKKIRPGNVRRAPCPTALKLQQRPRSQLLGGRHSRAVCGRCLPLTASSTWSRLRLPGKRRSQQSLLW